MVAEAHEVTISELLSRIFNTEASIKPMFLKEARLEKHLRSVVYKTVFSQTIVLYELNIENLEKIRLNFLWLDIIPGITFNIFWGHNMYDIIWQFCNDLVWFVFMAYQTLLVI